MASVVLDYHEGTKHSVEKLRSSRHFLDWSIQPRPFKLYRHLSPVLLPSKWPSSQVPALAAIAAQPQPGAESPLELRALARLLYLSAGIVRRKVHPGGHEMFFRAAACTGALYHIDVYVVCAEMEHLGPGVYHFGPHDFALRGLRAGDHRAVLWHASGGDPGIAVAPVVLVFASTFWRNSWKYQARAYRHCFWDSGTMVANLLAAAAAAGVAARVVLGFADDVVNHLIGVDGVREATLLLVALGRVPQPVSRVVPEVEPLSLETEPLSDREVDYPQIRAAHAASSLPDAEAVRRWRKAPPARVAEPPGETEHRLPPPAVPPDETIERVVARRGSSRHFERRSISFEQLSALLQAAIRGVPGDCFDERAPAFNDAYVIVNAVEGLPAGAYVYHHDRETLECLRRGDFRREAGFLALGQDLAADAAVNVYMLCALEPVLARYGERGYRAAQLEGGILGGRLYLAAYALRLGATGLTFFDDDVIRFFSPHAAGKSVMFLAAVGQPAHRR